MNDQFTYDPNKSVLENAEANGKTEQWWLWYCMTHGWPEAVRQGTATEDQVRHLFAEMLRECGFTAKERKINNTIQREMTTE